MVVISCSSSPSVITRITEFGSGGANQNADRGIPMIFQPLPALLQILGIRAGSILLAMRTFLSTWGEGGHDGGQF